jgi:soluble lytic murein transglycosylase-like protein
LLPAPAGGKPSSAEKPPASPAARLQPRISADQAQINVTEITAAQNGVRDLTNTQVEALVNYISRKYLVSQDAALLFVDIAHSTGGEYKVDPLLLLAVMAIESRFNPYAGGPRGGATGLMQIMSSVHRDKVNRFGRGESGFYNPAINGKIGAYILAECINRRGTVALGLVCYVGASDPSKDGGYAEKVQAERHRMALAASIPARD